MFGRNEEFTRCFSAGAVIFFGQDKFGCVTTCPEPAFGKHILWYKINPIIYVSSSELNTYQTFTKHLIVFLCY